MDRAQRAVSRVVWVKWLLSFGSWEWTGLKRFVPWRTFSETVWDEERFHPGTKRHILALALALGAHIYFRTTMKSAWVWAESHVDEFELWIQRRDDVPKPPE
jgi:hypothetical protein